MPQVDLSLSSVCGGDSKVACDTIDDSPPPETTVPDYAPESFWLSKDAEFDWLDQSAFIERKNSGKGSVTSIANSSNLNHPNSVSSSQRYSLNLKSKASIIGLPKAQKPNYSERRTCRPANIRLFPKRPGPVSGRAAAVSEPSSPKVSCVGRVRSTKDRSQRGKNRKKQTEQGLVQSRTVKDRQPGFWKIFRFMFRSKGQKPGCDGTELVTEPAKRSSRSWDRKRGLATETSGGGSIETAFSEPPGLGGVKRFASGRRSDAWVGEVEVNGSKSDHGPIWRRREAGPPAEVNVARSWQATGPASV